MRQFEFELNDKSSKEHGGELSLGRRHRRRPLSTKHPIHLVMISDFAYGARSLLRHRPLIEQVLAKAARRFRISIYEKAIVSNHVHLLVRGRRRIDLQNFFRVIAGHIAQQILAIHPIQEHHKPQSTKRSKENIFWQTRIFSRLISWGREFRAVRNYVIQNFLEAANLIKYKMRRRPRGPPPRKI
jgi:REP element-mobilizing transposase RayT